jgi:hypothetical protein
MPKHGRASKRDSHGNLHVRHDGRAICWNIDSLGVRPGLTGHPSIFETVLRRGMDARVKPAHDASPGPGN